MSTLPSATRSASGCGASGRSWPCYRPRMRGGWRAYCGFPRMSPSRPEAQARTPVSDARCFMIELTRFSFPGSLPDRKANFRLQVAVRYRAGSEYKVQTVILPGLDIYWECSKDRNREVKVTEGPGALVRASMHDEIDMAKAGAWGTRFRVCASELYELRVTVFDVDRKDWLEKVADVGKAMLNLVVDLAGSVAGGALKSIGEEAAAGLGKRMSAGDDDVLICHSAEYNDSTWKISRGGYSLAARGRSLFAEFRCSGSLAMSDWPDGRHRCPFEVPDARQTPSGRDQAANGRKSPPLQAPGRADAGLVAQQQPDVAGGRLNQHPLADILMATHPHPP